MTTVYITKDGDVVDWVAWSYYGTQDNRTAELVYEANPGLADRGAVLPAGIEIILPDITPPTTTQGVRLWD